MTKPWIDIAEDAASPFLLIGDHASNHVPSDIKLGIAPALLDQHIAIDLGVEPLGRALCAALDCPGILGGVSRLVIDFNREETAPHIIPTASDGHAIPGNAIDHGARQARIARFWKPYHQRIAEQIAVQQPRLLISLHSFTPQLATAPDEERPWEVGILYNEDDRAARIALPLLGAAGVLAGDQLPYSGKLLNATMNAHGEANGIAYLGLEVRQDLLGDALGVARWADVLASTIARCQMGLMATEI
jgi:predicted N-formylglutamate amidohydrolase